MEAFEVFQLCRGQYVAGPLGEPVDINILAIRYVMELLGVQDTIGTLRKVQHAARAMLSKTREQKI